MADIAMTQIDLVRVDDGQDGEVSQEQIAQITQDATTSATQAAQTYVDAQDFATETYADGAANTAQTNAINTAAADATEKADEAAKTATNFLEKDENGDVILMDTTGTTSAKAIVKDDSFAVVDNNGKVLASFGIDTIIGDINQFAITIDVDGENAEIAFYYQGNKVAYLNQGILIIPKSMVLDEMMVGDQKWSWRIKDNNNLYLKWIGN